MVALFVAVLILIVVAASQQKKARNAALQAWGQYHGLTMVDPDDPDGGWLSSRPSVPKEKWDDVKALKGVPSGSAQNFQEGVLENHRVRAFDTWYVISTGKTTVTVFHGVVALDLTQLTQGFALRKHNLWDSIVSLFGTRDIEIGFEDFDRAFHVSGDESFLKRTLNQDVVNNLIRARVDGVVCTGNTLVVVRAKQCAPEEFEGLLMAGLLLARKIER